MGKMEYLDALKRAMIGLPPDVQAKTLAYYEQRFVDGVAAGRSEDDVGRELDDPKKIAMTLRASAHLNSFSETKNPANLLRFLVSAVGLAIFNLFMVVPAAVFGALLTALYVSGFAFYLGGAVVTASGLAGANEFTFKEPVHRVLDNGAAQQDQATVTIGPHGIQVYTDKAGAPTVVIDGEPESVIRGNRNAGRIRISTDMDEATRTTQIAVGVGMIVGGIALLLISLVITRYTFIGIRRYLQMNLSLLKGR